MLAVKMFSRRILTLKLTYAAMLAAIAVLFPQLFHLTGIPGAGQMFLPMHIPVLICGLWLGPFCGGAVGAIAPLLSCLLTQMPTLAKMPFMMIELAAYGIICGVLYRAARLDRFKFGIYPALIGGMLGGRAVYALALTVATYLLRLEAGTYIAVVNAVVTGAVGIVIQLVFVPPLVVSLEKMTRFTR